MKKLIIIGAGGHGRVVADIAKQSALYSEIFFLDDQEPTKGTAFPYLGKVSQVKEYITDHCFFVAIGNAVVRKKLMEELFAGGATVETIIHPSAIISSDISIGTGTVVMPGAIVNIGTTIGKGCILNTASSVDHDCNVSDYCHVSVGAHLCGTVSLGETTWIGAGATIVNNVDICSDCLIGAGAVVTKNIIAPGKYYGVPARPVI